MAEKADDNKADLSQAVVDGLAQVRIVLVGTSHAGNIGAVARAMKNMGLSQLVLVTPQAQIDEQARANAKHALDVLDGARCYDSLDQALAGSVAVWATSARPREMNLPAGDVRAAAADIRRIVTSCPPTADVSILFGAERTGLTNAELLRAQALIEIPANPDYPVLNLSQAVQVVGYELRMAWRDVSVQAPERSDAVATEALAQVSEVGVLVQRLGALLDGRRYFGAGDDPDEVSRTRERLLGRVRLLLNRARLSANEAAILHGMLTALGRAPENKDNGCAEAVTQSEQ